MPGLCEIPMPLGLLSGYPTIVSILPLLNPSRLMPVDVLNLLRPSYFKKPGVDPSAHGDPDPLALAKDARHLSKYIFPSQYRLSSVFVFPTNRKPTSQQPDYSDREHEIKVRVSHVP